MRRKLFSLACGLATVLGAGSSMASVDDAQTAIQIAHEVCIHPGGMWPRYDGKYPTKLADWHVQRDGNVWRAWSIRDGRKALTILIPQNGPIPKDSNCNSPWMD